MLLVSLRPDITATANNITFGPSHHWSHDGTKVSKPSPKASAKKKLRHYINEILSIKSFNHTPVDEVSAWLLLKSTHPNANWQPSLNIQQHSIKYLVLCICTHASKTTPNDDTDNSSTLIDLCLIFYSHQHFDDLPANPKLWLLEVKRDKPSRRISVSFFCNPSSRQNVHDDVYLLKWRDGSALTTQLNTDARH